RRTDVRDCRRGRAVRRGRFRAGGVVRGAVRQRGGRAGRRLAPCGGVRCGRGVAPGSVSGHGRVDGASGAELSGLFARGTAPPTVIPRGTSHVCPIRDSWRFSLFLNPRRWQGVRGWRPSTTMPALYGGSRVPKLQPTPIRAARSLGGMPSRREARRHKSGHHSRGDASPKDRIRQHWTRSRVLLLNATFEPLTALPLRRAVVMLVCGKAEVVHGHPSGMVLHSASASVPLPSVIRLNNYVRVPYRAKVPLTRAALMHRDGYRCAYCGGKAETIDHVVPKSRGGAHSWLNCVASCAK